MQRTRQNGIMPARGPAIAVALLESSQEPSDRDAALPAQKPRQPMQSERQRHLEVAVRQRIESRLSGRLRNLIVRVTDEAVVLEGECATYYTKQLAQHAALGILEDDEHLENGIVVNVPR